MIMSKMIVKWLEWIIEGGIWITLIVAFIAGVKVGNGIGGSIGNAILYTVVAGVFCAVVFGGFILLMEIRTGVKNIEKQKGG